MRHLLFICLLLFCVACEENESVDPTIMPEATTTGANTFGCTGCKGIPGYSPGVDLLRSRFI